MNVVFRTDSSISIGSGHLMRCLTLACQLRKQHNAEICFICRNLDGNLSRLVEDAGFKLLLLPRGEKNTSLSGYEAWLTVPEIVDAKETYTVIERLGKKVDRLVVDSYAITAVWEHKLRPLVKEIFVIDDLANRPHDCDILLDQNFYLNKDIRYAGLVPEHCKMLLGSEHALLREEFYEAKKHLRKRDGNIKNILVFYGGSDLTNETEKAIKALVQLHDEGYNFTADIITGVSNSCREKIEKLCSKYHFLHYYCQVSNMAEFMNKADLMLGAGGSTTWERLYMELPALVTAVADNQVKCCEECEKAGLIDYAGPANYVDIEQIYKYIRVRLGQE